MITDVLVNGEMSDGRVAVTESTVLRGDGCFEVVRSYQGRPFALEEHLDRLAMSARALGIDLPPQADLKSWVGDTAAALGDGAVRVVVGRGSSVPGLDSPTNVIVFGHTFEPAGEAATLLPVEAPWHAAGAVWDLAGAKVTSYAPNMAATRRARAAGFDDAVLLSAEGAILEGPTFCVAWVGDDVLETPTLGLGILDSITRRLVLDGAPAEGIDYAEGRWPLDRLQQATEVMAMSTLREVQAVTAVGELRWEPGPVTKSLSTMFERIVGSRIAD